MFLTRKEISARHKIHPDTLAKLIKEAGIKTMRERLTVTEYNELKETVLNPLYLGITRRHLANFYNVHHETLSLKLKELGIHHRNRLKYSELSRIYYELGLPSELRKMFPKESENYLRKGQGGFSHLPSITWETE